MASNTREDTLFHDKYREVILCEFQHELALVRRLIELVDEGVRSKKPADTWSHEGFCHLFVKSIIDYAKMSYDNMQLGHFLPHI